LSGEKLLRVYDVNPLPLLREFLSNFLIASEEASIPGENLNVPWDDSLQIMKIRHRIVIIQISLTDRTLELNPHYRSASLHISVIPYAYKETHDGNPSTRSCQMRRL